MDLTAYVLGVSIHQGAERWGERYETGTASVTVDNTTGILTPESGSPDPWFRDLTGPENADCCYTRIGYGGESAIVYGTVRRAHR